MGPVMAQRLKRVTTCVRLWFDFYLKEIFSFHISSSQTRQSVTLSSATDHAMSQNSAKNGEQKCLNGNGVSYIKALNKRFFLIYSMHR